MGADLKKALKKSRFDIEGYRSAVDTYRNARNKDEKRQMLELIEKIKSDFRTEIGQNSKEQRQLHKLNAELYQKYTAPKMFEEELTPAQNKKLEKERQTLEAKIEKLTVKIEEIKSNKIYENAFEWRFEFPEVLDENGDFIGFDVVIGNPPYIRQEAFSEIKPFLSDNYKVYTGTSDLYTYFVERGMSVLSKNGEFIFIIPNKWMRAGYGRPLRDFAKTFAIQQILDFGDLPVFEEATTYPCIIHLEKSEPVETFTAVNVDTLDFSNEIYSYLEPRKIEVISSELPEQGWTLIDAKVQKLLAKLRAKGTPLGEYVDGKIYRGVLTGLNEAFVIDRETRDRLIAEDPNSEEIIKPFLGGRDIKRYQQPESDKFLILFKSGDTADWFGKLPEEEAFPRMSERYPSIMQHLQLFEEKAKKRYDQGQYWWELRSCDYYHEYEKEKIMLPDISLKAQALIDTSNAYCANTGYIIPVSDKYVIAILNSNLSHFFYSNLTSTIRGGYLRFIRQYLEQIPIHEPDERIADEIREKVEQISELRRIDSSSSIAQLECEIDRLVYELYGLTEEEIGVVENNS